LENNLNSKIKTAKTHSVRQYLEVLNEFLARDLSAVNFLHNEVPGGKKRRHKLLNECLKMFIDVYNETTVML